VSDERDLCPRCGNAFHCGVADATPCACTTVRLHAATLASLREQFDSCLCLRCLIQLQDQQQEAPTKAQ